MAYEVALGGDPGTAVGVTRTERDATVWIGGRPHRCALTGGAGAVTVTVDARAERVWIAVERDTVHVHAFGRAFRLSVTDPVERALAAADEADVATAPMPGTVVAVAVEAGDEVHVGQPLVVIESMKMQSEIVASRDGTVERVLLAVGETFDRGAALVGLVPVDAGEEG